MKAKREAIRSPLLCKAVQTQHCNQIWGMLHFASFPSNSLVPVFSKSLAALCVTSFPTPHCWPITLLVVRWKPLPIQSVCNVNEKETEVFVVMLPFALKHYEFVKIVFLIWVPFYFQWIFSLNSSPSDWHYHWRFHRHCRSHYLGHCHCSLGEKLLPSPLAQTADWNQYALQWYIVIHFYSFIIVPRMTLHCDSDC
jgi:hypothetical protein